MRAFDEVSKVIKKHKADLREKYKIKDIGIFGSYVRDEQKERSDVDILVALDELPDLLEFIGLERYLENLLKKKVDLVRKEVIIPELRQTILSEVVYL